MDNVIAALPTNLAEARKRHNSTPFRKLSAAETQRYNTAQQQRLAEIDFDPDTELTAEEQIHVRGVLASLAADRPAAGVAHPNWPHASQHASLGIADQGYRIRLQRRLSRDSAACAWLDGRGCSNRVIVRFSLGLSREARRPGTNEVTHSNALVAPLVHRDGRFYKKYAYRSIPGVTIDHRKERPTTWSAGDAHVYYSDAQKAQTRILVCDSLLDLWAIWDAMHGSPLAADLLLVASTNHESHPEDWKHAQFWEPWGQVYLAQPAGILDAQTRKRAGDERAKAIARRAKRQMHRVWPIGSEDWVAFFKEGNGVAQFEALLSSAEPLGEQDLIPLSELPTSWFVATPVDIAGGFHNGFLFEVLEIGEYVPHDETGDPVERRRTIVVRSDRTTHSARQMQAPKGTPAEQLIYRLWPDGAVIQGPLRPRLSSTWAVESIQKFIRGDSDTTPLAAQIERTAGHLRASVWLPHDEDYMLLACTVVVTYVQPIFEAVPLLLATGAHGTGKTQLGIAMTKLCANAPNTTIGKISAASIARLIDQTRGFVVLDDLESIASRRGGDAQFDELVQALKLSYNKQSAVKYWTNMKTGRLERLNFFGVKLINNTRGVDAILGSRMFTISTRAMPVGIKLDTGGRLLEPQIAQLRNELHVWAFSNVQAVQDAYTTTHPNQSTRAEEIAAPLRTIGRLAGSASINATLQRALDRQAKLDVQPETPDQVLRDALTAIVTDAVQESGLLRTVVTITEIIMKMALLADPHFRKNFTNELSEIESPEWVGRQLKQLYVDTEVRLPRIEFYGKFLRSYQLTDAFISAAMSTLGARETPAILKRSEDPRDFCRGCAECPYRNHCDMRAAREAREAPKARRPTPLNGH